ncbi:sensor histidine kinase [Marinibaculum pumilum]|uniref:histidine kinase n=1 Tax=Marinibaculum pumilum TaxID=1766165 RepID=A0ABV7L3J6_9PROT
MQMERLRTRDVFVTEALARREPSDPDFVLDNLALQDLAARMVADPEAVLSHLVDLALEATGSVSGGISVFESEPAPGLFRWHNLRGELERFSGCTTPRHYSPCGVCLDESRPVLVEKPERAYSWLVEAGVGLPECLLVPLFVGGTEPLGTLWVVSEEVGHFDRGHTKILSDLASFTGMALHMRWSRERLEAALEEQRLLMQELSHRVKNSLQVVGGILRLDARNAGAEAGELLLRAAGRVQSIATIHDLACRSDSCQSIELSDYFTALAEALEESTAAQERAVRVKVRMPRLMLPSDTAIVLALIVNETVTNAVKHAFEGRDGGTVRILGEAAGGRLKLTIADNGRGKGTAAPSGGLGSGLIQRLALQLGAELSEADGPEGHAVVLDMPVADLTSLA